MKNQIFKYSYKCMWSKSYKEYIYIYILSNININKFKVNKTKKLSIKIDKVTTLSIIYSISF